MVATPDGLRHVGARPGGVRRVAVAARSLGTSYVGSWVGNVITLGTTISAFGCCLACTVGEALTAREGIAAEHGLLTGDGVAAGNGGTTAEA